MIELEQGQEIDLTTPAGEPLRQVTLGLGWDKNPTSGAIGTGAAEVDLDASAFQFAGGELFDLAFYNNLRTRDGSVVHLGDNTSGRGEGDDEVVNVDLMKVHPPVDTVLLLVSSYQGHSLEWVSMAYCRVLDEDGTELARHTISLGVQQTGLVMAALVRSPRVEGSTDPRPWRLRALGEGVAATVPTDAVRVLRPFAQPAG